MPDPYSIQLKNGEVITIPSSVLSTGTSHNAVTVTDTASINFTLNNQDISADVLPAGVDHQSLAGILGSTSYYHVSSGVHAVLTTGLSSAFATTGDYVPYSGATSNVALGSYSLSGATGTFSSGLQANNLIVTSGLTATTGNFSSGINVTAGATIGALLTASSSLTVASTCNISSGLNVGGNLTVSSGVNATTGTFTSGVTANNIAITSGLTATTGNFSSSVDILGNLDITSGLTATTGNFSSGINVTGASTFSSNCTITALATLSSNATIAGGLTVSSTLGVQNTARFSSYAGFGSTSPTLSSTLPFYCYALSSQTKTFLFGGTDHPTLAYDGWDTQGWSAMEFYTTGGNGAVVNLTTYSSGTAVAGVVQVLNDYITSGSERRIGLMGFSNESVYNDSYFTLYTMSSGTIKEAIHIDSLGFVSMGSTSVGGSSGTVGLWVQNTVSAIAYADRTPYPKDLQEAYDSVLSMSRSSAGGVDHKKLHSFINIENYGRDLSATVSALNEVVKDLIERINKLENK